MNDAGTNAVSPVAATNGAGTWVVAWSTIREIAFSRSTDNGLTFGPAAILNTDFATDDYVFFDNVVEDNDFAPSLAADTNGRFIAVWSRTSEQGEQILVAHSDDLGTSWSPPGTLAEGARSPGIATDGEGTWIIVWPGHNIGGAIYTDIYATRSTDGGNTWSPPATLVADAAGDAPGVIGTQVFWSGGAWVVTWVTGGYDISTDQQVDRDLFASHSTDGGLTWAAPSALHADDQTDDDSARLASDGAGNWIATWPSYGTDASFIYAARSSDGATTWSAPIAVASDFNGNDGPVSVAAGPDGEFVVVWQRGAHGTPDAYGLDADVFMASTDDDGATWSPWFPLNDAQTDPSGDDEIHPFVAYDPSGHWLALWSSKDRRLASGTKGPGLDMVYALAGHPCGNGLSDPGEECDDGNRGNIDCCTRACTLVAADTACAPDDDLCTLERCDGSGTCLHQTAPAGTACTADDDLCTFDRCDGAATCEHVLEAHTGCKQPLAATRLQMEDSTDPAARSLRWKWPKGEASAPDEIAAGLGGTNYGLCVFDPSGLLARVDAPAGPICGNGVTGGCWKRSAATQYRSRDGMPNGMTKLTVKGTATKTSIGLSAAGENLELPSLPLLAFPVRAQLVNDLGACWEATYAEPIDNTDTSVRLSSD
ncbi:MAG TPA: exo-alpha-sialidase [Candidatus Limnocylindrales bacterium]|nr:exo-alpha-sialidase [Candidatus Limnocylindrales bacterium]